MTNLKKLKELLDKMDKANSTYSNERHIGGTLLEDFSRAENRLCESAIAMLPAFIAVAEAADRFIGDHPPFESDLTKALAELKGVKLP